MERGRLVLDGVSGELGIATRRTFLGTSLAGLPGLSLAAGASRPSRQPACIVFFLDGGPSHHETFDPKPNAPSEVRGEFGTTHTSLPGLQIGDRLPRLAQQARHYSIVRSMFHGNPSHAPAEHQMMTGRMGSRSGTARAFIETPSLGSIVSRLRGPNVAGLPAYVGVPWSFHHSYGGSPFGAAAYLGARHEPFESGPPPRFDVRVLRGAVAGAGPGSNHRPFDFAAALAATARSRSPGRFCFGLSRA